MSRTGLKIRDAHGNLIDWDMPDHIPHVVPIAELPPYCSCGWKPTPRGPILTVHLQAEREGAWRSSGGIQPGGDVGGDYQVSDAHSVRFIRPDLPGSLITDSWYVEKDEKSRAYWVRCQVEFMLCRDPADPGSTELWAGVALRRRLRPARPHRSEHGHWQRPATDRNRRPARRWSHSLERQVM